MLIYTSDGGVPWNALPVETLGTGTRHSHRYIDRKLLQGKGPNSGK